MAWDHCSNCHQFSALWLFWLLQIWIGILLVWSRSFGSRSSKCSWVSRCREAFGSSIQQTWCCYCWSPHVWLFFLLEFNLLLQLWLSSLTKSMIWYFVILYQEQYLDRCNSCLGTFYCYGNLVFTSTMHTFSEDIVSSDSKWSLWRVLIVGLMM